MSLLHEEAELVRSYFQPETEFVTIVRYRGVYRNTRVEYSFSHLTKSLEIFGFPREENGHLAAQSNVGHKRRWYEY
jgi:hypothetical protein